MGSDADPRDAFGLQSCQDDCMGSIRPEGLGAGASRTYLTEGAGGAGRRWNLDLGEGVGGQETGRIAGSTAGILA